MSEEVASLLNNPSVREAFRIAWLDSNPGIVGGHEEGGFILRDPTGMLSVARWPRGESDSIELPPHADCLIGASDIVASFHTHPNTGADYLQEPGETDRRAVRDDPDLKGANYIGEFVISQDIIYLITPNGQVREIGSTETVFTEE